MGSDAQRKAIRQLAYLADCAVSGVPAEKKRVAAMNMDALYHMADRHSLTGITAYALESAGVKIPAFTQAKGKAIRKVTVMELEKEALFAKFEEAGIWYLPLKGAVMKDLYPKTGMRQMSDFDIMIDASREKEAGKLLEEQGFAEDHSSPVHNSYYKRPVCNFELHKTLFVESRFKTFYDYYRDIRMKMLPTDGTRYGYHLSDEDFYIYMIAHEYKHYTVGGTGLRSLLDIYVCERKLGGSLDRTYIYKELAKLGIVEFEKRNRRLAMDLFGGGDLTAEDEEMLDYMVSSGTYGNTDHRVSNGVKEFGGGSSGRLRYFLSRAFLPMGEVQASFPFVYKHKILLPALPVFRLARGLTTRRKKMRGELKALRKAK